MLALQSILGTDILLRIPPIPDHVDIFRPRDTTTQLDNAVQQIRLPSGFWELSQKQIATSLGLPMDRINVLVDESYIRLKASDAETPVHADFFYFVRSSNVFQFINNTRHTPNNMCVICKIRRRETRMYCRPCMSGYIPVFTAWISLGTYSRDHYALLEILPKSHLLPGYDDAILHPTYTGEVPLTGISEDGWRYACNSVCTYDMVIFNCKTLHRARAPTNGSLLPRVSIDIRFMILP